MSVDFFLTDYDQLSVGKYRIIFGLAHSNDFFGAVKIYAQNCLQAPAE